MKITDIDTSKCYRHCSNKLVNDQFLYKRLIERSPERSLENSLERSLKNSLARLRSMVAMFILLTIERKNKAWQVLTANRSVSGKQAAITREREREHCFRF